MTEIDAHLAASLSSRFRLIRQLGAGGMGAVFLAEQIAVGNRLVALKVLSRRLLDDPDFLLRFQNEAASTGRIHHVNVVTIYESGQADDGTPYIAMEFLEGESLRQALARRGALPVPAVAEILQQAARGLNAAHKLGIIHRDLKPDNIFLTYPDDAAAPLAGAHGALAFAEDVGAGLVPALPIGIADTGRAQGPPLRPVVVKIVDFGIAKLRESGPHTQTGMVLGTPAYMSFEQASGMRSDELDARSDVYSLGVVVYEMLTGRTPFHSDTPVGYLRMHMQEAPPPFRTVKPDLPALPQLESVVMKALTKDRSQRYSSVLEFAQEFVQAAGADSQPAARADLQREVAKHQPLATVAPVPKTSVPASVRGTIAMKPVLENLYPSRGKWFVVAGSLVLLTVAATGGFWYRTKFGWRRAQGQVESRSASSAPSGLRPREVETPISSAPPLDFDMSSVKPVLAPSPPTQAEQQEWRVWRESNAHVSRPAVGSIPYYSDKEIRDLKEGERVKAIKKISLCDWTKLGGEHLEVRKRPGFGIHTSYIVETLDGRQGYVRADYVSLDNGVGCNESGCSRSQP